MTKAIYTGVAVALVAAAAAAACGGGSSNGGSTSPTPTSPTTPTTPSATATITIGADGAVTPKTVTITQGGRVTFVNNHSRAHDMNSDPHPEHTDCPELAAVGFLSPGQSRTSSNLNTRRTCGYHDHNEPDTAALRGSIIIQ
jgi:plastocyanin